MCSQPIFAKDSDSTLIDVDDSLKYPSVFDYLEDGKLIGVPPELQPEPPKNVFEEAAQEEQKKNQFIEWMEAIQANKEKIKNKGYNVYGGTVEEENDLSKISEEMGTLLRYIKWLNASLIGLLIFFITLSSYLYQQMYLPFYLCESILVNLFLLVQCA